MRPLRRGIVFGLVLFALASPGRASAWTWPVDGPVLQAFAFDPAHPYAGGQHRGIDVGAATGDPVRASADGVVSFAGTTPGNGLTLSVRTADGYTVSLAHLGSFGVHEGATVAEGDTVGTVGPSGTPELAVPYVHLGIRTTADPNGYVDPLLLLPVREAPHRRCRRRWRGRLSCPSRRRQPRLPIRRRPR